VETVREGAEGSSSTARTTKRAFIEEGSLTSLKIIFKKKNSVEEGWVVFFQIVVDEAHLYK